MLFPRHKEELFLWKDRIFVPLTVNRNLWVRFLGDHAHFIWPLTQDYFLIVTSSFLFFPNPFLWAQLFHLFRNLFQCRWQWLEHHSSLDCEKDVQCTSSCPMTLVEQRAVSINLELITGWSHMTSIYLSIHPPTSYLSIIYLSHLSTSHLSLYLCVCVYYMNILCMWIIICKYTCQRF